MGHVGLDHRIGTLLAGMGEERVEVGEGGRAELKHIALIVTTDRRVGGLRRELEALPGPGERQGRSAEQLDDVAGPGDRRGGPIGDADLSRGDGETIPRALDGGRVAGSNQATRLLYFLGSAVRN